jgi:hypothetical protein
VVRYSLGLIESFVIDLKKICHLRNPPLLNEIHMMIVVEIVSQKPESGVAGDND